MSRVDFYRQYGDEGKITAHIKSHPVEFCFPPGVVYSISFFHRQMYLHGFETANYLLFHIFRKNMLKNHVHGRDVYSNECKTHKRCQYAQENNNQS